MTIKELYDKIIMIGGNDDTEIQLYDSDGCDHILNGYEIYYNSFFNTIELG